MAEATSKPSTSTAKKPTAKPTTARTSAAGAKKKTSAATDAAVTGTGKPEPTFDQFVGQLATAESVAKAKSADAGEARAVRSQKAVGTILTAYREGHSEDDIRTRLLDAGIAKGTVSKIVTVVKALHSGKVKEVQVESLNGAYNLAADKGTGGQSSTAASTTSSGVTVPTLEPEVKTVEVVKEVPGKPTPETAIQAILDDLTELHKTDPTAAYRKGGEYINEATQKITDLLKNFSRADDDL